MPLKQVPPSNIYNMVKHGSYYECRSIDRASVDNIPYLMVREYLDEGYYKIVSRKFDEHKARLCNIND
jgi:hypothetical protein